MRIAQFDVITVCLCEYGDVSVAQQDLCTVTIEGTIVSIENRVATAKEVARPQEEREKNSPRSDRWNNSGHSTPGSSLSRDAQMGTISNR